MSVGYSNVISFDNAMKLLERLPEDLIPGVARGLAYRIGLGYTGIDRAEERFRELVSIVDESIEPDLREQFERARVDLRKKMSGPRPRTGEDGEVLIYSKERKALKRKAARAEKDSRQRAELIDNARKWFESGRTKTDFLNMFNIFRKDKSHLPGLRQEVEAIWSGSADSNL